MNCPHCGWGLKIQKEWVDDSGYHAIMVCDSTLVGNCNVEIRATTDLKWAYENNRIRQELIPQALKHLISNGQIVS